MITIDKVTAFITHQRANKTQILLLRHPYAGNQFPAGTVEEGESFETAVLREVKEETGLQQAVILSQLGEQVQHFPGRMFTLQSATVYARPDENSFDWAKLPRGTGIDYLREQSGFVQVSFIEGDIYPNPAYTTYQITGWVRADCLTAHMQRRFYHLTSTEDTPPSWQLNIDQHTFTLFWADAHQLPEIVSPQDEYWLRYRDQILATHTD